MLTPSTFIQLTALLQLLDDRAIAVSKLCCPTCWVLLGVLRGHNSNTFLIHGHHNSFYPVGIPEWLPIKYMRAMLQTFEDLFLKELSIAMAAVDKMPGNNRDSMESDVDRFSDGSLASGELEDPEAYVRDTQVDQDYGPKGSN
jgi:hypothetical protein